MAKPVTATKATPTEILIMVAGSIAISCSINLQLIMSVIIWGSAPIGTITCFGLIIITFVSLTLAQFILLDAIYQAGAS